MTVAPGQQTQNTKQAPVIKRGFLDAKPKPARARQKPSAQEQQASAAHGCRSQVALPAQRLSLQRTPAAACSALKAGHECCSSSSAAGAFLPCLVSAACQCGWGLVLQCPPSFVPSYRQ